VDDRMKECTAMNIKNRPNWTSKNLNFTSKVWFLSLREDLQGFWYFLYERVDSVLVNNQKKQIQGQKLLAEKWRLKQKTSLC